MAAYPWDRDYGVLDELFVRIKPSHGGSKNHYPNVKLAGYINFRILPKRSANLEWRVPRKDFRI